MRAFQSFSLIASALLIVGLEFVNALPLNAGTHYCKPKPAGSTQHPFGVSGNCFPSLGFKMPSAAPANMNGWWCDPSTEYAFVGFSYEVTACQSVDQLKTEFKDMRNRFNSRYVRLYGACDRNGFYDDVVEAAWDSGLGVHALIWFGFDGDDKWIGRRDALFSSLFNNPKAKFVTRVVQFGSEPLFDSVMDPNQLASSVLAAKASLKGLGIPVTVSEMAYGYQKDGGAQNVLDATDSINIHMLPFFAGDASTAKNSWPIVMRDLQWFIDHANGKKLYLDENGWPSTTYPGVQANSAAAVPDVNNEGDYFNLLDSKCEFFKTVPGGGVGWFAHLYSDNQEPGYGVYGTNGQMKFQFSPRTSC
jgi:exo-beta-1,3-glucanase (GH17 family)